MTPTPPRSEDRHLVGVLGGSRIATVDDRGALGFERALWRVEWWVGADDRWHLAGRETAVRQVLVDGMPVVRTAMRVPGGDAVHDVFGATADAAVVDVENASPAPFVVAFVVRGATVVALDDATVLVDGVPALTALRPPSRWAVATDGRLDDVVTRGGAVDGAMPVVRDRGARVDAAFLYPVAHRTRLRVGVALGRHDSAGLRGLDLTAVPDADAVVRGWQAQLDRGMRVALPEPVQASVDADRAQLLLAGQAWRADADVGAALEDWGFDDEAVAVWQRMGMLERRRARRRGPVRDEDAPAGRLLRLRRRLIAEEGSRFAILPAPLPDAWRGHAVDVRTAPTRLGPVSYSVRWHGERAALLWEVPPGAQACAPGLDPAWSTTEPRGETLLAPLR